MHKSPGSLPQGEARCRACRGQAQYGDGPSHGTKRRYNLGCRCESCRTAVNEAQRKWQASYKAEHGAYYTRRYDRSRTAKPHEYTESMRRRDAARRARLVGARVESFTHTEVYERDGWVCGICTEQVNRSLTYPNPMSPSLDHIVPLSLGGEHSRANTRLSHLTCNVKRGAARGEDLAA